MTEIPQPSPSNKIDILNLTTGSEEEREIIEKRDRFFQDVLDGLSTDMSNPYVEQKTKTLGFEEPGYLRSTDDKIHTLEFADEVIAIVFDRRTDWNKHEVTFWQRQPVREHSLEIIEKIKAKNK